MFVNIKKDNMVVNVPYESFEADYKKFGWEIVGDNNKVEKNGVIAPAITENSKELEKKLANFDSINEIKADNVQSKNEIIKQNKNKNRRD